MATTFSKPISSGFEWIGIFGATELLCFFEDGVVKPGARALEKEYIEQTNIAPLFFVQSW